jgi:O-acetyl-ADP-ribose deacetylase (regulator of RNase III)
MTGPTVICADITTQSADAIVNSAHRSLLAGSGLSGLIHRAAGPELELACKEIGGCPTGTAVLTPGFKLAAKHVIHAVGPRWLGGSRGEAELLERCYHSIFDLAVAHGLRTVCSPSISTGIYRFPLDEASLIAARVAKAYQSSLEICFVCYDEVAAAAYRGALDGQ